MWRPSICTALPAATVETISLGVPTGSSFIAAVMSEVPPEPPMPMTPHMSPDACARVSSTASAALTAEEGLTSTLVVHFSAQLIVNLRN